MFIYETAVLRSLKLVSCVISLETVASLSVASGFANERTDVDESQLEKDTGKKKRDHIRRARLRQLVGATAA